MISPIYTAHCDSRADEKPEFRWSAELQRNIGCFHWTGQHETRAGSRREAVADGWVFVGKNCYCPDCRRYGNVRELSAP